MATTTADKTVAPTRLNPSCLIHEKNPIKNAKFWKFLKKRESYYFVEARSKKLIPNKDILTFDIQIKQNVFR